MTGCTHVELVMGTAVSFDIRDDIDAAAIGESVDWLHWVDAMFSTYKDTSMITRFARAEIGVDDLDPLIHEVLDMCSLVEIDTGGAFSMHMPAPNGTNLEPSGLVKGWSIERCVVILERHGARNFTINAGGDIAIRGEASPGVAWRTGIRHPEIADQLAAVISASGLLAIATSARYERGDHIIDPRSGMPATGLASVTIVGPDLTYVDAYATAVFVMGIEGLTWLMDTHPDHGGFVITNDHQAHSTPLFNRLRVESNR